MLGRNFIELFSSFINSRASSRLPTWWDLNRFILSVLSTGFAVYFFVISGVFLWQWVLQSREAEYQYHQRAEQNLFIGRQQIADRCAIPGAPADIVGMCLADEMEKFRARYVVDEDLLAQKDMARWTTVMGVISVISVMLSALGLIALWRSLQQTRQAISLDRDIGHAQVRAYLSVEPLNLFSILPGVVVTANFRYTNIGQSPARAARYVVGIIVQCYPLPDGQGDLFVAAEGSVKPQIALAPGALNIGEASSQAGFTVEQIRQAMNGGDSRIYLAGIIWYEDVFGQERKTRFCYYLEAADQGDRKASSPTRIYNWHMAHVHNDET